MNIRRLSFTILVTLCALTGILALASTPASAYLKHKYLSQITGTPEGTFSVVCGLSIDPVSQDLYVSAFGNNVVDIFDSSSIYQSDISGSLLPGGSFGGIFSGEAGHQCTAVVSDVTGDIYVLSPRSNVVYVFGALGNYLEEINGSTTPNGPWEEEGYSPVRGLGIDQSSGDIYISDWRDGIVDRFNKKNEYQSQVTGLSNGLGGLTVSPAGDLYVGEGETVKEFNPSSVEIAKITGVSEPTAIAVDSEGNVYVGRHHERAVDEFNSSGILESQITSTPSESVGEVSSVAVNSAGDLYVSTSEAVDIFGPGKLVPDVGTGAPSGVTGTTAILNGTVNPDGLPVSSCEFEYGATTSYGQTAPCEQTPAGSSPVAVIAKLSGLQAGTQYHYRVVAANANGNDETADETFFTLGARIQKESFSDVRLHGALAVAQINPEGASTTYHVEYGTSEDYGSVTPMVSVGSGSEFTDVSATLGTLLEGVLHPETTYYFRVVASNEDGITYGPVLTFTTWSGFAGLPDDRGYELVSPLTNANGNVFTPSESDLFCPLCSGRVFRASASGDAVMYAADPLASGGTGFDGTQGSGGNEYVATRDSGGGWSPIDLSTPGFVGAPFEALFSSELVNSGTAAVPAGTHRLSNNKNDLIDSVGGRAIHIGVLPDGTVVSDAIFGSLGGRYEVYQGAQSPSNDLSHIISADGSRIFWTDLEEGTEKERVFVRENDEQTVPVSVGAAKFSTASIDGEYAFYTENGSLYRFDVQTGVRTELTTTAFAATGNGDLRPGTSDVASVATFTGHFQVGEVIYGPGVPENTRIMGITDGGKTLQLSNLVTAYGKGVSLVSGGPEVLSVIGVNETGEDGAYIYFVANGVLGEGSEHGATPDKCVIGGNEVTKSESPYCNLYVLHAGVVTFIAALTPDDLDSSQGRTSGEGVAMASLEGRVAEVAPDGHALLFEARASLTGYTNNGVPEAYVYDTDTGRLSCVSCNPTGTPAVFNKDGRNYRPLRFSGYGTFMPRWISEDGTRVFFESEEALVAQDTDGSVDVYEWEQDGTGSCESAKGCVYLLSGGSNAANSYFLDASANGDDAFIISRAELVPEDQGETYEVYDARVGGEWPVEEPACTGTGCQGLPASPPFFATPSSVTFAGVGNFSPSQSTVTKPKSKPKFTKCRKGFHRDRKAKCVRVKIKKSKARQSTDSKGSK